MNLVNLLNNFKCASPIIDNHNSKLPSVIVPDIHGRSDFVLDVFSRYEPSKYNIIFTGDILHTEGKNNKWRLISQRYSKNWQEEFGQEMEEEWNYSIGALEALLDVQRQFPNNVFFLRGNHDDISCKLYSDYGKYAWPLMESQLFRQYAQENHKEVLNAYYAFENKIPYLYIGHDFIASHTIPDEKVSLKDIKFRNKKTHWLFSWADNTAWDSSCLTYFEGNINRLGQNAKYWFCGHRPVNDGLVRVQCGGKLVQNNHSDEWVVIEKPWEGEYVASLLKG